MKRLPVLTVAKVGNSEYPRFAVKSDTGRYWTGEELTRHPEKAQLHCLFNDAATASAEALKKLAGGGEPRRYIVPMVIEVYGEEPVDQPTLAHFLSNSLRIYMDARKNGHGPKGSLVIPIVEWTEMKQEEKPNENHNSMPIM